MKDDITVKMSKHRYPEPHSSKKSWLPFKIKDPAACKKRLKAGTTEKAQIRMQRKFEECRALLIQGDLLFWSAHYFLQGTLQMCELLESCKYPFTQENKPCCRLLTY